MIEVRKQRINAGNRVRTETGGFRRNRHGYEYSNESNRIHFRVVHGLLGGEPDFGKRRTCNQSTGLFLFWATPVYDKICAYIRDRVGFHVRFTSSGPRPARFVVTFSGGHLATGSLSHR